MKKVSSFVGILALVAGVSSGYAQSAGTNSSSTTVAAPAPVHNAPPPASAPARGSVPARGVAPAGPQRAGGAQRFYPGIGVTGLRRFPSSLPETSAWNQIYPAQPVRGTVPSRVPAPQPATASSTNAPANRALPRADAADDILARMPPRARQNTSFLPRQNSPSLPQQPRIGSGNTNLQARAGSDGTRTPVVNSNIGGRRGGGVVPFNNADNVNFNDAAHRCRDWRDRHGGRDWWRNRCPVVILIGGGYYGWDAGWWYPAWGYSTQYSYYPYDGPIYGYDGLPPDQVIANVQGVLQELGYFTYAVDGVLGPATQAAIADFQRDRGLYTTGAVDRPTLIALGLIG